MKKIVKRQCIECDHIQEVESYTHSMREDGSLAFYFGSAYDFCNKCDGVMTTVDERMEYDALKGPPLPEELIKIKKKPFGAWQLGGAMGLSLMVYNKKPNWFHIKMMKILLDIDWVEEER